MADRRHPKAAIYAKQKKVTEQILRNLAKGVKSQFSSHFCPLWDQWDPNKKLKKQFLVFSHTTIPASLKEIHPAVSEIQMLTDGPTDEK